MSGYRNTGRSEVEYRRAELADVHVLAAMNRQLIRDEGHCNRMTEAELAARMADWLAGEYESVLFLEGGEALGYALYRREPDHVYLRQFFIRPESRRQGAGRAAFAWLREHAWGSETRIRLDVLVGNASGRAFWQSVGFAEYCLTMELEGGGRQRATEGS
jgi:GNAT superfamily N-acetyltransferase